jgi:protein gp37
MASKSAIEWTEATWNPVTGCDQLSPGCDNCYAKALARRLKAMGNVRYQTDGKYPSSGPGFGIALHHDQVDLPKRWRSPRVIFVNSMSDLFHAKVPTPFIRDVFATMLATPQHTYQVLTKRPKRLSQIADVLPWPSNVWMGTSIESNDYVWRADYLRRVEAAVRFLSIEPMLGPVPDLNLAGIDWVITGGESGHGARPVDISWVRDVRDRCNDAGVAYFHKQWGGRTAKSGGRELDGRLWDEMPAATGT